MRNKQGRILVKRVDSGISVASILCQTDFLAKSDLMIETLDKLCDIIPLAYHSDGKDQVDTLSSDLLIDLKERSKEKIILWDCFYVTEIDDNIVEYYLHHDGKKFAVVELESERTKEASELCHNIAMHIVAFNPKCVSVDGLDWTNADLEISEELLKNKPPNIIEKIKEGKKKTYIKKHVLLEQPYVKDPNKTVRQVIEELDKDIKIKDYQRVEV